MSTIVTSRALPRAIPRASSLTSTLRATATRPSRNVRGLQQSARRQYSSNTQQTKSNNALYVGGALASLVAIVGGYRFAQSKDAVPEVHVKKGSSRETVGLFKPTTDDYQKVYNAVAKRIWEMDEYEDGSYGPVILRLAWHASGTYDVESGTGGSNGATMRFSPENNHGANNGLVIAREFLEPIKKQFPWISYSDLWTLAGVCAVQEMQGPVVPWRPGRQDRDVTYCTPDGRLPDASKEQNHLRRIFGRMGFNDQEIVALSGAHALGRCHTDRSGFDGPWTFSPTVLTNDFYRLLVEEEWGWKPWDGNKQYEDKSTKSLMMLPTDMALVQDKEFKKHVVKYAKDGEAFFKDFSAVICKLFELGVPFREDAKRVEFTTLGAQETKE